MELNGQELAGKVAVVTGGSRGIGRAIVEQLARGGARVAVVARSADRAEAVAAELHGEGHRGYACDVADSAAVDALVKQVEGDFGSLDILVNNAGVTEDNLLLRLSDEDWDRVQDTNLKGAFHTIRAATKGMMRRRSGRIINITSVVGLTGNKGQANYAASKAGLIGLTHSAAVELGPSNINVNAVAPGYIRTTRLTEGVSPEVLDRARERSVLGRLGDPQDVAHVVVFLCSEKARHVTGAVIPVDGGYML